MDILLKKLDFEYANFNGKIAVAISGGLDSMCLLDFLRKVPNRRYELLAINVEHGIRGDSSLSDSRFVADFCLRNSIKLISESVNVPSFAKENKISVESAARQLRYEVFEKAIASNQADLIALAHHSNDLCETILMRIFRGTGIDGLQGIQNRNSYIRPFLTLSREDIKAYATRNSVPFVEDESNFDNAYTRNFIRNELIPLIALRWENYDKSLLRLANTAKEYAEYFDKISPKAEKSEDSVCLRIAELEKCELPVKKHSIRKAVALFFDGVDFEETNLNDVLALIGAKNGATVHLANGLRAYKEYDKLIFALEKSSLKKEIKFQTGEFEFAGHIWEIVPRENENLRFDITKIPEGSVIRNREDGDSFIRFGGVKSSLGDFYTNKKVPKRLREEYPIVAFGNQVLVTPIEIAEAVKSSGENEYTMKIKNKRSKDGEII